MGRGRYYLREGSEAEDDEGEFLFLTCACCRSPAIAHGNRHGPPVAHPPSVAGPAAGEYGATAMAIVAFGEGAWQSRWSSMGGGGAVLMVVHFFLPRVADCRTFS